MEKSYKVFIGGLPVRVDKDAICQFFSKFGTVLSCKLKKNQQTGRSLGFAYLTIKEKEAYDRLLEEEIEFHGRIIEIKPIWKKKELGDQLENEKKKKLFVSNLPEELTNTELIEYFSKFGQISNAYIIKDPDTKSNRHYGYVIFKRQPDFDHFFSYCGSHIIKEGKGEIHIEKCLSQHELKEKRNNKGQNRRPQPEATGRRNTGGEFKNSTPAYEVKTGNANQRIKESKDTRRKIGAAIKNGGSDASIFNPLKDAHECTSISLGLNRLNQNFIPIRSDRNEESPLTSGCSAVFTTMANKCKVKGEKPSALEFCSQHKVGLISSIALRHSLSLNENESNYFFKVSLKPWTPFRPRIDRRMAL